MPPKSSKKPTKVEKEKLKQEEEERRVREAEEEKQRKAEEDAERKVREKVEAEERKRLETEESKRRKTQLEELNQIMNDMQSYIRNRDDKHRKDAKWERYMRCDGSADPTIAGEINTYLNLQREDNSHNDIESVLKQCQHTRELTEELDCIITDTPSEELSEKEVIRYNQTTNELENLVNLKLDLASHDVTLKASQLMNSETLNLQSSYISDQVKLYIWGNLSKNPRIKSFEFPDGIVSFEIPKILTLMDCAYRCMITSFDHFSHYSKSFKWKRKEKEEGEVLAAEEEAGEPAEGEGSKEEGAAEGEEAEAAERENTEDLMAMLHNDDGKEDDEEQKEPEEQTEEQPEVIEDDLIKTPEPEEFEDFDGDEDTIDLRAYSAIGGIIHFNLLHMPPQPRQVGTWVITQSAEPQCLNPADYIADDANPVAQLLKQKAQQEDDPNVKREDRPPISVQLKLSDRALFFEEPIPARWDSKTHMWRTDGFMEITFVEETRRLTFKTCYFGTFGLMQDIHINMPFQSWEIRPIGINHCLFTLIAAIVELEIEIKDEMICLKGPADRQELLHLIKAKWMPFPAFKKALVATGVNIFPNEDSHKYVTIQDKNVIAETRLYQQMGLTASSMAYSWSKWNGEVTKEKLVFQAAQQLVNEPLTEDEWGLFLVTRKRSMKLRMTEFEEEFSEDFAEGTEFHADMYHMSLQLCNEDGANRIRKTSRDFAYNVAEVLKATRLLIYA